MKDGRTDAAQDASREALNPASIVAASSLILVLGALTAAMAQKPSGALRMAGVSETCNSRDCVSARQVITASDAVQMKRRLASRALVVDIDEGGARVPGFESDVHATFVEGSNSSGLVFRTDFCDNVDSALRAAKMRHDETVIVVSAAPETAVLAALLLQERGYTRVLVAREPVRDAAARKRPA